MKSLLYNHNIFIALLMTWLMIGAAVVIRRQPVYYFVSETKKVFKSKGVYTDSYLDSLKLYYQVVSSADKCYGEEMHSVSDDSLFLITLKQFTYDGIHASNQFPTCRYNESGEIVCKLHMKAKENFDLTIVLKKSSNRYIYSDIKGLQDYIHFFSNRLSLEIPEPNGN